MPKIKNKEYILDAIEELRNRKARPDLNGICKYLLTYYKVSPSEAHADLRRCIRECSIIKVVYKNNISYRSVDLDNWQQSVHLEKKMAAAKVRRIVTSAIATLIYQDQVYLEKGISFDLLVKTAASQNNKHTKKQIESMVNKELSSGSLIKLPNGNLALGPADNDADSSDSAKFEYNSESKPKVSSANSSGRSSPVRMRGRPKKHASTSNKEKTPKENAVRVGERRKMAKKVFDPSDNNVPNKRKRGRPAGSLNKSSLKKKNNSEDDSYRSRDNTSMPRSDSQGSDASMDEGSGEKEVHQVNEFSWGVCSVCLVQRPRGSNDRLVECRDCNNKAHLTCLQDGILKLHPDSSWRCPHCKTCVTCCETSDAGILTVCSVCSDAYHVLCHTPRISERMKATDQWECNNCLESHSKVNGSPAIVPKFEAPNKIDPFLKPHEIERATSKLSVDVPIDTSIPDITKWTCNDVYNYFQKNFPEAAPILKEQEFDGQALCMARRVDIVRGLGLPLGPALTLYRMVVKLQTRVDDWTMCWG